MEEKKYLKRKERAIKGGNREVLAQTCNHLGDFYNQQGRYQHAVMEYEQEAMLYSKLGKQLEMAKAHRMVHTLCVGTSRQPYTNRASVSQIEHWWRF
ncbi:tonsoku-like protein [Musca autumnalis]|uniref:tonsoku-like protein n=1 Tax=Musca autumnalis TaxID=221902 RepID=UPI003CEA462F